jgi:hypothetical protein
MSKTLVAAEVIAAFGLQYGLSRFLTAASSYAEDREERELATRTTAPATPSAAMAARPAPQGEHHDQPAIVRTG